MTYLEIQKLSFGYGESEVFSDLSMQVRKGQVFCLVGPNGCGKTTLQHCVLNLLKPSAGEILVEGRSIKTFKERELAGKLAFVPQSHVPTFPYQALDVVAMGSLRTRSIFGGNDRDSRQQAMELLEDIGIGHLAQAPYTALSGGEMQLVMIARALCQNSEMLVLDEPTAHLDIGRSQDILNLISRINRERGITILMATHDFNQPLFFEDEGNAVQMALMNEGRISKVGTPVQLLKSGLLEELYGVKSQVLTLETGRKRHYLATWKET